MMFAIIPDYVSNEIDRKLDAALAETPDAKKDRDHLKAQLTAYFVDHGVVPDFSLAKLEKPQEPSDDR